MTASGCPHASGLRPSTLSGPGCQLFHRQCCQIVRLLPPVVICPCWLQPEEQDDLGEEVFGVDPNFVPRDSMDMDSHQVSAGSLELLMS